MSGARKQREFDPPRGTPPVLQFVAPSALSVDPIYQRSTESGRSRELIHAIARSWDWNLCLPLVVSRRGEGLFVIDGQHRLEAALVRGDIAHLPCVVGEYANTGAEAADFVRLNVARRALSAIELFKAQAAGDQSDARQVLTAITAAGLSLAPHTNFRTWKPGMVSNIGGILAAQRLHGPQVTRRALEALGRGFEGQVLRFCGTLFIGMLAVCRHEMASGKPFAPERFERFVALLRRRDMEGWVRAVKAAEVESPWLGRNELWRDTFLGAWRRENGERPARAAAEEDQISAGVRRLRGARPAREDERDLHWCAQCERLRDSGEVASCRDKFCKLKDAA